MTPHRTPREKRAQAAAATAIARATAHTHLGAKEPDPRPERYPVTPEVARAIRLEAEETQRANNP
ncbi:hypothetical protein GCM10010170_003110 [Dactylosporangium salmoneum]|uniref:Uncharacterized protein n=1 Tax=Dactylosporangium salmoneum TaxID=53361 RepID=A0ABN3FCR0_9ACTN